MEMNEKEEGEIDSLDEGLSLEDVSSSEETNCNSWSKPQVKSAKVKHEKRDAGQGKENRQQPNELNDGKKAEKPVFTAKPDGLMPISSEEEDSEFVGLPGSSHQILIPLGPPRKKKKKKKKKKEPNTRMLTADDFESSLPAAHPIVLRADNDVPPPPPPPRIDSVCLSRPRQRSPSPPVIYPARSVVDPNDNWDSPPRSESIRYRSPTKRGRSPICSYRSPSPRQRSPRQFVSPRLGPNERRGYHRHESFSHSRDQALLKKWRHTDASLASNSAKGSETSLKSKLNNILKGNNTIAKENTENQAHHSNKNDDDEDVELLRRLALDTKKSDVPTNEESERKKKQSEDNDSDDMETMQLRCSALKTAIVKKYGNGRPRGVKSRGKISDSPLNFPDDVELPRNDLDDMELDSDQERQRNTSDNDAYSPTDAVADGNYADYPDMTPQNTYPDVESDQFSNETPPYFDTNQGPYYQNPQEPVHINPQNILMTNASYLPNNLYPSQDPVMAEAMYFANNFQSAQNHMETTGTYYPVPSVPLNYDQNHFPGGPIPLMGVGNMPQPIINTGVEAFPAVGPLGPIVGPNQAVPYPENHVPNVGPEHGRAVRDPRLLRNPANQPIPAAEPAPATAAVPGVKKISVRQRLAAEIIESNTLIPLNKGSKVTARTKNAKTLSNQASKPANSVNDVHQDILNDLGEYIEEPLYLQGVPDVTKDAKKIPTLINKKLVPVPILKTNKQLQQPMPQKKTDEPIFRSAEMQPVNIIDASTKTGFVPITIQTNKVSITPAAVFQNFSTNDSSSNVENEHVVPTTNSVAAPEVKRGVGRAKLTKSKVAKEVGRKPGRPPLAKKTDGQKIVETPGKKNEKKRGRPRKKKIENNSNSKNNSATVRSDKSAQIASILGTGISCDLPKIKKAKKKSDLDESKSNDDDTPNTSMKTRAITVNQQRRNSIEEDPDALRAVALASRRERAKISETAVDNSTKEQTKSAKDAISESAIASKKRVNTSNTKGPPSKVGKLGATGTVSLSQAKKLKMQQELTLKEAKIAELKAQKTVKLTQKVSVPALSPKIAVSTRLQPLVIRLGDDSDSTSDEGDRTQPPSLPPDSKISAIDLDKSIEEFLRSQREKQESSAANKSKDKPSTSKANMDDESIGTTPLAVRHLPPSRQEEYRRLRQQVTEREQLRKKQVAEKNSARKIEETASKNGENSSKPTETSSDSVLADNTRTISPLAPLLPDIPIKMETDEQLDAPDIKPDIEDPLVCAPAITTPLENFSIQVSGSIGGSEARQVTLKPREEAAPEAAQPPAILRLRKIEQLKRSVDGEEPERKPRPNEINITIANNSTQVRASDNSTDISMDESVAPTVCKVEPVESSANSEAIVPVLKSEIPKEAERPTESQNLTQVPPKIAETAAVECPQPASLSTEVTSNIGIDFENLDRLPEDEKKQALSTLEEEVVKKRLSVAQDLSQLTVNVHQLRIEHETHSTIAKEVRQLRLQLKLAENQLYEQATKISTMTPRISQYQSAIKQGRAEVTQLKKICHGLGEKLGGPDYEVPSTGDHELIEKTRELKVQLRALKEFKTPETSTEQQSDTAKKVVPTLSESQPTAASAPAIVIKAEKTEEDKKLDALPDSSAPATNQVACKVEDEKPVGYYESILEAFNKPRRTDPNGVLCPYELRGTCNDDSCLYTHLDAARR